MKTAEYLSCAVVSEVMQNGFHDSCDDTTSMKMDSGLYSQCIRRTSSFSIIAAFSQSLFAVQHDLDGVLCTSPGTLQPACF